MLPFQFKNDERSSDKASGRGDDLFQGVLMSINEADGRDSFQVARYRGLTTEATPCTYLLIVDCFLLINVAYHLQLPASWDDPLLLSKATWSEPSGGVGALDAAGV